MADQQQVSVINLQVWPGLNGGKLSGPDVSGNPGHCHTGGNKVRKENTTNMHGRSPGRDCHCWTWAEELPCLDFSVGVDFPDLLTPQDLPNSLQVFGTFCFPSGLFIVPICLLGS